VIGVVAREATAQVAAGLAGAAVLAILISRVFAASVEQVPVTGAPVVLGIVAALALASLIALALPARRAARIEIAASLRAE
jgi:ABC-type antimicrobial peptide transport system permease subunit